MFSFLVFHAWAYEYKKNAVCASDFPSSYCMYERLLLKPGRPICAAFFTQGGGDEKGGKGSKAKGKKAGAKKKK